MQIACLLRRYCRPGIASGAASDLLLPPTPLPPAEKVAALPSFHVSLLKRVGYGTLLLFVGLPQLLHNIFKSATPPST
jgi:hypothetical protein